MKKLGFNALVAIVLSSSIGVSHAAPQWCYTKVSDMVIESDGNTIVKMSVLGQFTNICSISATWKGVPPLTCMSWVSLLRSAIARNSDMIVYYSDAPACTAIPAGTDAPAPHYIMMRN